MALKYFVYKGMQFTTATVPATAINSTGENVDVVTLESIVPNLGTDVVAGRDVAAQVTELKTYWDPGAGTPDSHQKVARQILKQRSNLATATADVGGPPGTTYNFHETSNTYILPVGLVECARVLPASSSTTTATELADVRDRLLIEALSVRHDNIEKHGRDDGESNDNAAIARAWDAYIAYTIINEFQDDQALVESNYLIQ